MAKFGVFSHKLSAPIARLCVLQRLLAADVITGGRDSRTDASGHATSQIHP